MNLHAVGFNVIPTLQGSSIFLVLAESRVLPLKTGGTAESSVLSIFIQYAGTFLLEKNLAAAHLFFTSSKEGTNS